MRNNSTDFHSNHFPKHFLIIFFVFDSLVLILYCNFHSCDRLGRQQHIKRRCPKHSRTSVRRRHPLVTIQWALSNSTNKFKVQNSKIATIFCFGYYISDRSICPLFDCRWSFSLHSISNVKIFFSFFLSFFLPKYDIFYFVLFWWSIFVENSH